MLLVLNWSAFSRKRSKGRGEIAQKSARCAAYACKQQATKKKLARKLTKRKTPTKPTIGAHRSVVAADPRTCLVHPRVTPRAQAHQPRVRCRRGHVRRSWSCFFCCRQAACCSRVVPWGRLYTPAAGSMRFTKRATAAAAAALAGLLSADLLGTASAQNGECVASTEDGFDYQVSGATAPIIACTTSIGFGARFESVGSVYNCSSSYPSLYSAG